MKKIIILLFLLIVVSCSKEYESQKSFENTMSLFQSGDQNQIIKILNNNSFDESLFEIAPFYLEYFKMIKYEIIDIKEKKDASTIKFSVEVPDLSEYTTDPKIKTVMNIIENPECKKEKIAFRVINGAYLEILKRNDLKYVKKEFTLNMEKRDNKWTIDKNSPDIEQLTSFLKGGLDKTYNEIIKTKSFKKGERGVTSCTAQTVTEISIIENPNYTLDDGNILLMVKFIKESVTSEAISTPTPEQYQIETKNGKLIKPSMGTSYDKYSYEKLPVGKKMEQILTYEIPKDQASKFIIVIAGIKIASYDLEL